MHSLQGSLGSAIEERGREKSGCEMKAVSEKSTDSRKLSLSSLRVCHFHFFRVFSLSARAGESGKVTKVTVFLEQKLQWAAGMSIDEAG